jgi:hypothetical protein
VVQGSGVERRGSVRLKFLATNTQHPVGS